MTHEKTTQQVTFQFNGQTCHGYEIHQGVTVGHAIPDLRSPTRSLSQRDNSEVPVTLGSVTYYDHCIGTYIHGFLDNAPVIEYILSEKVKSEGSATAIDYRTFKELQYDKLAEHVRKYVDIPRLYQILQGDD
jgi:adenosylcobyric acid synthase